MFCYIPSQKITLIDYTNFFITDIQNDIINTCHEYNLIKNSKLSLTNKDIKKIFYHCIILKCCYFVINADSPCIFCLDKNSSFKNSEILNYIDSDKLGIFINKTLKQISKLIPLCVTDCNCSINELCADIGQNKGEAIDFLTTLKAKINKNKSSNITLQKAKKFAKLYELNFIDSVFLNKLTVKAKILS